MFDEKEVKLIRKIIQEVIDKTNQGELIGATETARIILNELRILRENN